MLDRLEKWRKQPVAVKQRYALLTAVAATLIIVGMWSTTLPSRLAELDFSTTDTVPAKAAPSVEAGIVAPPSPSRFSVFTASVMDGYLVLKAKLMGAPSEPLEAVPAPTAPMVWNEVVEAKQEPVVVGEGRPIMIAVATTSATTSNVGATTNATTTSEAVIQ
jgi:hypothetical protein